MAALLTCGFVGVWTIGLLGMRRRGRDVDVTPLPPTPPAFDAAPVPDVAGEGQCGHCGYACVGLSTPVCPECGRDVRVVGISVPGRLAGAATRAARQRWAAYVILAGLLVTTAVWDTLRYQTEWVAWTMPAWDKSHLAVLTLQRSGYVWPFVVERSTLRFEAQASAQPSTVPATTPAQLEYADGRCGVPSLATPTDYGGPLTPAAVAAAMRPAGLNSLAAPFSTHAAEWALRLDAINSRLRSSFDLSVIGYSATGMSGSGSGRSAVGLGHLVWISGLALAWLAGDLWVRRSRQ